jgi:hypothetical protein
MKPSREAMKETADLLHEILIIPAGRDVNPGIYHELTARMSEFRSAFLGG